MAPRPDETFDHPPKGPGLLGLVVELGKHQARHLPDVATKLPALGVSLALGTAETVRRELTQARQRGGGVLDLLRPDTLKDVVRGSLDAVRTPGFSADVEEEARELARRARETRLRAVEDAQTQLRETAAAAAAASPEAREVGAPGTATAEAERVTEAVGVDEAPDREDLPIPDYDSVSLAALRTQIRKLDTAQLVQLREYEKAHADRLPVLTLLENRIAKLAAETAAEAPAAAEPTAEAPATGGPAAAGTPPPTTAAPTTSAPATSAPATSTPAKTAKKAPAKKAAAKKAGAKKATAKKAGAKKASAPRPAKSGQQAAREAGQAAEDLGGTVRP